MAIIEKLAKSKNEISNSKKDANLYAINKASKINSETIIENKTLGEICEIIKGSSKYTEKYCEENLGIFPVFSSKTTGNIFFAKINQFDFSKNKTLITSDGAYAGTILFSKENFSITSHCYALLIREENILDKYLFYYLKASEKAIKTLSHGSTRDGLSKSKLKDFIINLPSLKTQKLIIDIIEPLDLILNSIELKENTIKRKLMFYTNFIFKNIHSISLNKVLGEICEIIKGSSTYTRKYCDENSGIFPVFSSKTTGNIFFAKINSFDFTKNKTLITSDGYSGTVLFTKENFSITSHCYILLINAENILDKYLFFYLKWSEKRIKQLSFGSTRDALSKTKLKNVSINFPALDIQKLIINILDPLHEELNLIKKQKKLYKLKHKYYLNLLIM